MLCGVMLHCLTCHILLGRLWQYNRKIIHDGAWNTYTFVKDGYKVTLAPEKEPLRPPCNTDNPLTITPKVIKGKAKESPVLLTHALFEDEVMESQFVVFLVAKEEVESPRVPSEI